MARRWSRTKSTGFAVPFAGMRRWRGFRASTTTPMFFLLDKELSRKIWCSRSCAFGSIHRSRVAGIRNASSNSTRCDCLDQAIETNRNQKNCANERVALEKGAIDAGDVERTRALVFIKERCGHGQHCAIINYSELRRQAEGDQGN